MSVEREALRIACRELAARRLWTDDLEEYLAGRLGLNALVEERVDDLVAEMIEAADADPPEDRGE